MHDGFTVHSSQFTTSHTMRLSRLMLYDPCRDGFSAPHMSCRYYRAVRPVKDFFFCSNQDEMAGEMQDMDIRIRRSVMRSIFSSLYSYCGWLSLAIRLATVVVACQAAIVP